MRRLRRQPRRGRRRSWPEGATGVGSLEELVAEADGAARGLGDGARRRDHRHDRRRAGRRCSRPATSIIDGGNSYYRDDIAPRRTTLARAGHRLRRLRHQRRRLRPRARLLPDDRRRRRGGRAARPDLRRARARASTPAERTPGRDGDAAPGRERLPALRPDRRRPLREDGPQRDRVRDDGRLRRGAEHPAATPTPASDSARADAETAPLEHPEYYQYDLDIADGRRGLAARQRDRLLAARPDRRGAAANRPTSSDFAGRVSDSGEGRWTSIAAIDEGVPAPVLTDRAVLALRLARPRRLRRQGALGDAQAVRRPRREAGRLNARADRQPSPCGDSRRRVRRPLRCKRSGGCGGGRDARRPHQPPPVSAAALSGRHWNPVRRADRASARGASSRTRPICKCASRRSPGSTWSAARSMR